MTLWVSLLTRNNDGVYISTDLCIFTILNMPVIICWLSDTKRQSINFNSVRFNKLINFCSGMYAILNNELFMSVDCMVSIHIIKCFNGHFQFYLGLPTVFLRDSKENFQNAWSRILQARCLCCCPTNSIRTLKHSAH